jgi:preprotein translocase subunit Sss1
MRVFGRIVATISVIVCVFGGVLVYEGWKERKLAANSTPDAVAVDLAKLEAGEKPASNHVKLGPHYAYYGEMVQISETRNGIESFKYIYYPIISSSHPDAKKLQEVVKANGGALAGVDDSKLPKLTNFVVLVKSYRFKSANEANNQQLIAQMDGVQGTIINDIESLESDEQNFIKGRIPTINFDKVLVLELDRKPKSSAFALMMMFGGIALLGVGAIGFIGGMILYMKN